MVNLEDLPMRVAIGQFSELTDEQLENMVATVRNMGRAGIPILGYHFMPNGVWRTSRDTPVRGGATATAFDLEEVREAPLTHGRVYTDEEMWATYDWYL